MSEWGTGSVCFEGVKVVGCCTCRMSKMKDESQASQELSSKDNSWGCRSEGYVATGSGSSLFVQVGQSIAGRSDIISRRRCFSTNRDSEGRCGEKVTTQK